MTYAAAMAVWASVALLGAPAAQGSNAATLRAYVSAFERAINAGDRAHEEAFIRSSFSSHALESESIADRISDLATIRRQSGGLDAVELIPMTTDDEQRVVFKVRSSRHWVRTHFLLSSLEPGKLSDIFVFPTTDPDLAPALPDSAVASNRIAPTIEHYVTALAAQDAFSGVVEVSERGRIVYRGAFGDADKSLRVANTPETRFHTGSMAKMFTAVAVAQLVANGRLRYDMTLASALLSYPNPSVARSVTIAQLLSHTAGLGDIFVPAMSAHPDVYRSPSDYFPLFAQDALLFKPGSHWWYSNAGFVVLGAVIERASGESYDEYVRRHILAPAGMTSTVPGDFTAVIPGAATGYLHAPDDMLGVDPLVNNRGFLSQVTWHANPAGGYYMTADDVRRFFEALRSGELLPQSAVETLTMPRVPEEGAPEPASYGYGFETRVYGGMQVRGHGGGGVGSGIDDQAGMFWNARHDYDVIVLGNYDPTAASAAYAAICRFLSRQ